MKDSDTTSLAETAGQRLEGLLEETQKSNTKRKKTKTAGCGHGCDKRKMAKVSRSNTNMSAPTFERSNEVVSLKTN